MNKIFFLSLSACLLALCPHLLLAQNISNADREKVIAQQMNCVEDHLVKE